MTHSKRLSRPTFFCTKEAAQILSLRREISAAIASGETDWAAFFGAFRMPRTTLHSHQEFQSDRCRGATSPMVETMRFVINSPINPDYGKRPNWLHTRLLSGFLRSNIMHIPTACHTRSNVLNRPCRQGDGKAKHHEAVAAGA